jgi:polysaccharide biosynthesis transport protein
MQRMSLYQSNWRLADDTDKRHLPSLNENIDLSRKAEGPDQYESLKDLLAVLKKYRTTIALVALSTVALTFIVCLIITPKYASVATIEVNRDSSGSDGGPASSASQPDDVKTEVETDTSILQDDKLALSVIHDLNLAAHPPFSKIHVAKEHGLPLDQAPKTREKYLKLFARSLKVESLPDTRLINVTFKNQDPILAASIVNTLCHNFIEDYLQRRAQSTTDISYWIGKELETLKKQVEDSEQALADYEHKTGLVGVDITSSSQGGDSVSTQSHNTVLDRLNTLNQELTSAEANRISSEAVYKLVQTQDPEIVLGLGTMNISSGGSALSAGGLDLLRSLRSQEIPLKTEYADLSTKFGDKNPRLLQLQNQINAVDNAIHSELQKISKRAENNYIYAKQNEDAVRDQFAKQQEAANNLTDATVQLQVLAQEAFSNRKLYEGLFSQLHQANVTAGIHATRLAVVSPGQITGTPVIPNYLLTLPISLVGGIIFGVIAAFARQSMDQSVSLPEDVESAVDLPVMAHLPLFSNGKSVLPIIPGQSILISTPDQHLSEAFRSLRTAILLSRPSLSCKTLMLTSPLAADGKTTVSYNLSIAFAQQGSRVLVIDGDMRNADLHRYFGTPNDGGLSEALTTSSKPLMDLVSAHPQLENLFILPAGSRPKLPAELFSSSAFDQLLNEAKANFDWVIIDTPPFLPFTDAAIISSKVDAVLPVLRSGVTSRDMLKSTTSILKRMRAPVIGFVLNGVKDDTIVPFHAYGYNRDKEAMGYTNA